MPDGTTTHRSNTASAEERDNASRHHRSNDEEAKAQRTLLKSRNLEDLFWIYADRSVRENRMFV